MPVPYPVGPRAGARSLPAHAFLIPFPALQLAGLRGGRHDEGGTGGMATRELTAREKGMTPDD